MLDAEQWGCRRLWNHVDALPPDSAISRLHEREAKPKPKRVERDPKRIAEFFGALFKPEEVRHG